MRTTITLAAALLAVALPASVQAQEPPTLSIGQIQGPVAGTHVGTAHRSPYVFQGQAQTLDHQFVSPQLADELERVRARINADWPKEHEGDGARGASDHDPVVSRFGF